ncbi:MAG TPA: hypothetical protein VMH89_04520 [Candidatus Acidoferrum sp.]|nr:hypothetical protein [Candidatus Acidoferrum sp.]
MTDWMYVQDKPGEQLAQLHYFSIVKNHPAGDVVFHITVKEFATPPPGQRLRFFAESDKAVNQNTASFIPCGWGNTLFNALGDCVRLIRQFPYEGEPPPPK